MAPGQQYYMMATPEEQRKQVRYFAQMNLLNLAMFSNNYKRVVRIAKILTKFDKEGLIEVDKLINGFEHTMAISVGEAQNFLITGLLVYDKIEQGRMYTRQEIETALEDLLGNVVGIAFESTMKQVEGLSIDKGKEEEDVM